MWALFLVVSVAALSGSLALGTRTAARCSSRTLLSERAFFAAEGGLAQARWELSRNPAYSGGLVRIGGSDVEVHVARTADGWRVEAAVASGALLRATLMDGVPFPAIATWMRVR
jgi:hypothetical protein